MSPFANRARENHLDFRGGKVDDITVLVGQVKLIDHEDSEKSNIENNGKNEEK